MKHVVGEFSGERDVDVLFVGEGPGDSEDVLGKPFIGRSGRKLREWVTAAGGDDLVVAYNNAVACKPQDKRRGRIRPPSDPEVEACSPRVEEYLRLLRPRAVVFCGQVAADTLRPILFEADYGGLQWHVPHPAWVLRSQDIDQETRYIQRLKDLFTRLKGELSWQK